MALLNMKDFKHESLSCALPNSVVRRTLGKIEAKLCTSEFLELMSPLALKLAMTGLHKSKKIGWVLPVILKSVVAMSISFENVVIATLSC